MADVEANIVLTTTGGDQAATEVNKATMAINSMTSASSGMQEQFTHRFQHIGLMLFAGDALRAAGLGMETRQIINGLNTALIAGEAAGGMASGGFLLVVAALTALAGIAVKVIEHHKDNAEALEKSTDAAIKDAQAASKQVDVIQEYLDAGGRLTALEKQEFEAKKNLAEATAQLAETELKQAIPAINQHIVALEEQRAHLVAQAATVNALSETWLAKYIPPFRLAAEIAKAFSGNSSQLTQKLGEIDVALEKQIVKLKEYQVSLIDIRHGNAINWEEKKKQIEEETQNHLNQVQTEIKMHQEIGKIHADERKRMDERIKSSVHEHQQLYKQEEEAAKHMSDQIGSAVGNAFAKSLVEGKDFTTEMKAAFKQMAEQIIADIVRMIVEWEILTALGFPAAGGGGNLMAAFGGRFASGGSAVVDSPTMFMAGEAGPEVATFTPIGSGGGGSGGGTTNNINISVTANGVDDPQELARKVGPALIQEIRGMGQLSYTRA